MRSRVTRWRDPNKPKHAHPEQELQKTVFRRLRWALPPPYFVTAIAHGSRGGGGDGRLRGIISKDMGAYAGIWDTVTLGPERFIGWIELKIGDNDLSEQQYKFGVMVRSFGHLTGVCWSLDDVLATYDQWGIKLLTSKPDHILDGLRAALQSV